MTYKTWTWLLTLFLLNLPAAWSDTSSALRSSTVVTFTPLAHWGVPLVQATINGSHAATLAVDTATNFSALTDKVATELGLRAKPGVVNGKPYSVLGKQADAVTVSTLTIGGMSIPNVPLVVLQEKQLSALLGPSVDGFIGANILTFFAAELDFPQHQLTLWYPGSLTGQEIEKSGFGTGAVLTMTTPEQDYKYSVPVLFRNGTRTVQEKLIVDTGAGLTTISQAAAQHLGLTPAERELKITTFNGTFLTSVAPVSSLNLGSLSVMDHNISYLTQQVPGYYPAVLGMDILSGYRVLLDFPSKKMYLTPPALVAPPVRIKSLDSEKR